MPNFPTIQSFFPTVPGPKNLSKTPPINNRYSDGFDGILESPATPWTPKRGGTYVPTKIGLINTGPGRISFIGRVANFREVEKSSKVDTAAKVLLRMALADDTGVIEVSLCPQLLLGLALIWVKQIKFWLTRPAPATKLVVLGALATVHATFVAALSPAERETSAANQMVSISDTDSTANVEFHETTDENWADFRIPVGASGEDPLVGLMPLRVFVESGSDVGGARLLVCVKWVCVRS